MSFIPSDLTDLTPKKADWRWVFLEMLARSCCVSTACKAARVSRQIAYIHRDRFPNFRRKWDEALEIGIELLEVEVRERAFNRKDPSSHILAMFLLKANRPAKYRDSAPIPQPPEQIDPADLSRLSPEDLDALGAIAGKLADSRP